MQKYLLKSKEEYLIGERLECAIHTEQSRYPFKNISHGLRYVN